MRDSEGLKDSACMCSKGVALGVRRVALVHLVLGAWQTQVNGPRLSLGDLQNRRRIWSTHGMLVDSLYHRNLLLLGHVHSEQMQRTTVQVDHLGKEPLYRDMNLAENNIYMRDFYEEFLEDIAGLVDHVRKDRDSPGLSSDQLRRNTRLYDLEMGTAEPAVENYFKANIFPDPGRSDSLKRDTSASQEIVAGTCRPHLQRCHRRQHASYDLCFNQAIVRRSRRSSSTSRHYLTNQLDLADRILP